MNGSNIDSDSYWPLDPSTVLDPYPEYTRLREAGPVLWHKTMQCWLVTSRKHAVEVLSDNATYARDWRRAGVDIGEDRLSLQNLDPPELAPLRRSCRRFLDDVDVIARLTAGIDVLVEERLAQVMPGVTFDFLADVVSPLGQELVARLLGHHFTPRPDALAELVDGITLGMDSGLDPARRGTTDRSRVMFNNMVAQAVSETPRSELISRLLYEFDKIRLSDATRLNSIRVLALSLYAAVTGAIANVIHTVLKHSSETARGMLDSTDKAFIDELLRFDNAVQATTRVALRTATLAGQTIRAGQDVTVLLGAANRDPDAFAAPGTLCPQRSHNTHLSFSHGAHYCLGSDIGREIIATVLSTLDKANFSLESAGAPSYLPIATMRRISVLPVRMRAVE